MITTDERDKLLQDWQAARNNSTYWTDREKKLRAEIALKLYPEPKVGRNVIDLGAGYTAVLERKQTRKFVIPPHTEFQNLEEAIDTMTEQMSAVGNSGGYHAEKLVKREFNLSLTAYKDLPLELQKVADEFIELKDSTPTFEIAKPKES